MKKQFDPIGPGTPAWNHFDLAVLAWREWNATTGPARDSRTNLHYTRYRNQRQQMQHHLKKHGGPIGEWNLALRCALRDEDFPL